MAALSSQGAVPRNDLYAFNKEPHLLHHREWNPESFGFQPVLEYLYWDTWQTFLLDSKVKGKCNLVQALRLCTDRMAHRGSRGLALLFHNHDTRAWGVSLTPWPLFTSEKEPVSLVQEAGWAPGSVWTGAENLAPTGIRSPDRPACSQSLYRLSYRAHLLDCSVRNAKLSYGRIPTDESINSRSAGEDTLHLVSNPRSH